MSFYELLKKRHSCRSYLDTPVDRREILKLIAAARMSPSASNMQPWKFIIVDEKETVEQLLPHLTERFIPVNRFVNQVPCFVVLVEDFADVSSKVAGFFMDRNFPSMDIAIAASNLCLQATEQGLSTCILGFFKEKKVQELLKIPAQKRVRLIVAVGYGAQEAQPEKKRKELKSMVSFNAYDHSSDV